MNDHASRLIDDDDILILINDIEGNILGLHIIFFLHDLPGPDNVAFTQTIIDLHAYHYSNVPPWMSCCA